MHLVQFPWLFCADPYDYTQPEQARQREKLRTFPPEFAQRGM